MALHMWLTVVMTALLTALPGGTGTAGSAGTAGGAGCAGAGSDARCWPVAGPGVRGRPAVLRAFEPPATPYAAGHRGVDLRAGPGSVVRAAAPGEVTFAGKVAGTDVVVLRLDRPDASLRVTYEPVRGTVAVGTRLAAGGPLGVVTDSAVHRSPGCLHWGLLRGDVYLDPLTLLPPWLLRAGPSRLLPVFGAAAGGTERKAEAAARVRGGRSPRAAPS
ncbi:peptidoglycan DD-metalloendopeptidase family protein [Streptomyces sp. NPDC008139]|uniref:peptidoglycan DD-metalloendopeptidase family protein n=1 Tax=Streptomyces sp. NPDC008139 TaxID=3364814 RepID=UPI0036E21501